MPMRPRATHALYPLSLVTALMFGSIGALASEDDIRPSDEAAAGESTELALKEAILS